MIRLINPIKKSDRRGVATVELALVLPVFFAVVLGVVEFGRAMMAAQLLTNAAREGARMSIYDGSSNSEVRERILGFLDGALDVGSDAVTITITVIPAPGNTTTGNEVANAQSRDQINVTVSVPFDEVDYIPGDYLAGKQLVGRSSMRHE